MEFDRTRFLFIFLATAIIMGISIHFGPILIEKIAEMPSDLSIRYYLITTAGMFALAFPLLGIMRFVDWCIRRRR